MAGLVMAAGMLVGAPAAHAEARFIAVVDSEFSPQTREGRLGDNFVFVLHESVQLAHTVTADNGAFDITFDQGMENVKPDSAGTYQYYCRNHGGPGLQGMSGVIVVHPNDPTTTTTEPTITTTTAPATTTTTAPATTSTTTPPTSATTTPTTRPAVTTSTTRPDGTTTAPTAATTAPKPSVQGASQATTTTTKRKSTTTTAKKKKATPSTVKVERTTTTTTMMPSLAAALPSGSGEAPTPASDELPDATEAGEEAASWVGQKEGEGGAGKMLVFGLGGLGALGLAGAGWGWYNRSSRYLSA